MYRRQFSELNHFRWDNKHYLTSYQIRKQPLDGIVPFDGENFPIAVW